MTNTYLLNHEMRRVNYGVQTDICFEVTVSKSRKMSRPQFHAFDFFSSILPTTTQICENADYK